MHHTARDETGIGAGQVDNGAGYFFRLPQPLERCGRRHALLAFSGVGAQHRRFDGAGGDHIDGDASRGELLRHGLGQAFNAAFGGCVSRACEHAARATRQRTQQHDAPPITQERVAVLAA